jgi:hypothetical protein
MHADIPEFIEDLPDVLTLAKKETMKRRQQTELKALDEDQKMKISEVQRSEDEDGDHNVLQPNVQFAILNGQDLFYDDIPDGDPIAYHDVDVGKGIAE